MFQEISERNYKCKEYKNIEVFSPRISAALEQPPIKGMLRINNNWAHFYEKGIKIIDKKCIERDICAHGIDHVLKGVSTNILILKDAIPLDDILIRHNEINPLFTDSSVIFLALIHDMGYVLKNISWEGKHAKNHAKKGAEAMEKFRKRILHTQVGDDQFAQKSLAMINEYAPSYHAAIVGNISQTPGNPLLTSLLITADKLDYFRSARVENVTPPEIYDDNPYFFLADAVQMYKLTVNSNQIVYSPLLKPDYEIPTKNGKFFFDSQTWKQQAWEHYEIVWKTASDFAEKVGKQLVTEVQAISF